MGDTGTTLTAAQIAALATPFARVDFTGKDALRDRARRLHWLHVYDLAFQTADDLRDHFGFTGDDLVQADQLLESMGLRLGMVVQGDDLKRVHEATYAHDPSAGSRNRRRAQPAHKL